MGDKSPRRWRKWLLIASATAIGLPLGVVFILNLIFICHRIPNEKLAPPPDLLVSRTGVAKTTPAVQGSDLVAGAKAPGTSPLESLRKIMKQFDTRSLKDVVKKFPGLKMNQPSSPEQAKWLQDHQDLFADLVNLRGLPPLSRDEVVAIDGEGMPYIAAVSTLMHKSDVLIGIEMHERIAAGDFPGALDVLLASEHIARAVYGNSVEALWCQGGMIRAMAGLVQTAADESIPPETALKMLEKIRSGVRLVDVRTTIEEEYCRNRSDLVSFLNSSFFDLARDSLDISGYRGQTMDTWFVADEIWDHPMKISKTSFTALIYGTRIKGSADKILQTYDDIYRESTKKLSPDYMPDLKTGSRADLPKFESYFGRHRSIKVPFPVYLADSHLQQVLENETQMNLIMAALEKIGAGQAPGSRPYIDRFASAPLRMIDSTTQTLIYSVGPDRTDQKGSDGDLFMRIPKRK